VSPLLLTGVSFDDVQNNPHAIIEAVANALGIPPEEISLDQIYETDKGVVVEVRHPINAETPKDFARQVNKQLRKHRPYTKAIVKSPGNR
jgi:hypothetical protein